MPTAIWTGNGQNISQVDALTISGATGLTGQSATATINGKSVAYSTVAGDTNATIASNWQAALSAAATVPPEFNEISWSVSANGITVLATAGTQGTPFTLTSSSTGGLVVTQTHPQANVSQSDLVNPANWLRQGSPTLPQTGDDVVLYNSAVPILWNVQGLAGVGFNSLADWMSMTGQVGLPTWNPLGYLEYRPLAFQFSFSPSSSSPSGTPTSSPGPGPAGALKALIGLGPGSGGVLRRYDALGSQVNWVVLNAGAAAFDASVYLLGTNSQNTLTLTNASVWVAVSPGETSRLASALVDSGASLTLGQNVSMPGTLNVQGGAGADLYMAPGALLAQGGSQVRVRSTGITYPSVVAKSGSQLLWYSDSAITNLVLQTGSTLDKSVDMRPMSVGAATVDGDTTFVLDPFNAITWGQITVNNAVSGGPFSFGAGRRLQII